MKHLVKIQGLCGIVFIICFDTIDFEVQKESQMKQARLSDGGTLDRRLMEFVTSLIRC